MSWSEFLLSFKGRIGRKPYWLFTFAFMLISIVFPVFDMDGDVSVFGIVLNILLIWPCLAVGAKRWHDRGKSAWWLLIVLIPVVGMLWALIECGFLRGTDGPNRFGPDPSAPPAFA
ncbi:DUF805 domain-containing protein [Azospirillum isscasi]|uniref:DUF805 domain-containing protein n=1 Tax=Azospirillum isscasi TaxID=3053926 RepID=A0ABU0WMJ5_9PROT|nr:DUF805 domain-containing protein [Azospirillum isscasi]MDQ2105456.1 DUF805 domain-containing protein [Azospirillum isscasi]